SFQNVTTGTDFVKYMRYDSVVKGCIDVEPDNFYFNFDGLIGRCSFDWGGNLVVSCSEKIKVSYQRSALDITSWTITRSDGTVYIFAEPETTETRDLVAVDECKNFTPITSWYLSEIRSANNTHNIKFTYSLYDLNYNLAVGEQNYYKYGTMSNSSQTPRTIRILYMVGKLLSKIESSDGNYISFLYRNPRTDVPGNNFKSLDEIQVVDLNGQLKRRVLFSYDYSSGRLTLRQLRETDASASNAKPPYKFFYNPTPLPGITSYAQDHWGYYNSNTAQTLIPTIGTRNLVDPSDPTIYMHNGANREPDLAKLPAGILIKMIYPSGGEVFYEYEPNDYSFIQGAALNDIRITGGLRVKRIIERDGADNSPDMVRNFSYRMNAGGKIVSSGVIFSEIKYSYDYEQSELSGAIAKIVPYTVTMATNRTLLGSSGMIGYRQVEVSKGLMGEGGKTVSAFSSAYDNPDAIFDFPPFPPSVSSDHSRGLLTDQQDYKYVNGQYTLVKEIKNHYKTTEQVARAYKMSYGIGGNYLPGNYDVTRFSITDYRIEIGFSKPDTTEELLFESGKSFSGKTILQYDSQLQNLKATINKVSAGKDIVTEYFYPNDYTSPSAVTQSMISKNILPVVEQIVSEKGPDGIKKTISGNFIQYASFGGMLLPYKTYKLTTAKPLTGFTGSVSGGGSTPANVYSEILRMDAYDNMENLLQAKSKEKEAECFLWGYKNSRLIAQVQN
ncbi:MAG TPA: hypothetical protein VEB42_10560, partial [Chitinophagaceae bacterium]|nr:hypothetical protein [Chitinophagaceae bacterium]